MNDLKHIHAVKAGEKSFVAGIVSAAVKHSVINKLSIVTVEKFSEKEELRLDAVCQIAEAVYEVSVETVSHIQSQTIYIKVINPVTDLIEDVFHYIVVAKVEFYKVEVAFPALIPEAVIIVGVTVKGKMKPVLIW